MVILADTSAWVEYDRATGSAADRRMSELIAADTVSTEHSLAVTEPVMMEVLAGARDDARERDLRRLLARFTLCPVDPAGDFDAAARVYRRCRREGVTPRGLVGCLIASVAWRVEASVLAADVDLLGVAHVLRIPVDLPEVAG